MFGLPNESSHLNRPGTSNPSTPDQVASLLLRCDSPFTAGINFLAALPPTDQRGTNSAADLRASGATSYLSGIDPSLRFNSDSEHHTPEWLKAELLNNLNLPLEELQQFLNNQSPDPIPSSDPQLEANSFSQPTSSDHDYALAANLNDKINDLETKLINSIIEIQELRAANNHQTNIIRQLQRQIFFLQIQNSFSVAQRPTPYNPNPSHMSPQGAMHTQLQ